MLELCYTGSNYARSSIIYASITSLPVTLNKRNIVYNYNHYFAHNNQFYD